MPFSQVLDVEATWTFDTYEVTLYQSSTTLEVAKTHERSTSTIMHALLHTVWIYVHGTHKLMITGKQASASRARELGPGTALWESTQPDHGTGYPRQVTVAGQLTDDSHSCLHCRGVFGPRQVTGL